jgi:hypothetical protein
MVARIVSRLTLALLIWSSAAAAWATGAYLPEIRFFSRSGQDGENNLAFFHGRLGILRPTMDDNRLFAAYRQMMGLGFTDAQAQQLLARCCDAARDVSGEAATAWNAARQKVLGPAPPEKYAAPRRRPDAIARFDVSCFPNAYRNAAAVLTQRIAEHGVRDPSVREWTVGQDAVLANCESDAPLPADVPDAPAWLKADRAYQIAAAHFYRFDYETAGRLFAAIGQDASSPWRKVSRYLVARAAVHAAIAAHTADAGAMARAAIAALASDPEVAEFHADAPRLTSLLAFATDPQGTAEKLAKELLAVELRPTLAADLHDLEDLERSGKRYTDVGAWLYDVDMLGTDKRSDAAGVKADVLRRWRAGHGLPWLVAATMWLAPDDLEAAEVMTAAQAIGADSPAYYTLAWHRLRLMIGRGQADDARTELDRLLASPSLPEGVENLLRYHRLKLTRDIGEFVKFAMRRGEFIMQIPDPRTGLDASPLPLPSSPVLNGFTAAVVRWRAELFQKNPTYFDEDGTAAMSFVMPLALMAQVVRRPGLPANLKRDLALAVWTRAVLLDDVGTALSVETVLAPFFPQFADDWKNYRGASDPEARKANAAILVLKLPAASPWPQSGLGYAVKRDVIGRFGPRWWGSEDAGADGATGRPRKIELCADCALPLEFEAPAFLTAADRAAAEADAKRLSALPSGPAWLGSIVIPWAKTHLSDPRVPQALHLVVRATQYGDPDSATSKAAYDLLHSRFPRNAWTRQTPLWF